ncbi:MULTISPECIES: PAS domain-containing sensor histidine kinase [unclassified Mesorhizobium]|uniref:PAS domain-containing sensor histidine kinase n=1 Tax=unclassified Mesorhizobium TaxID=325217 RepID=UPI000FD72613|nr:MULTISPECIES: PAS domain-containing sensor histidine kinase [unclassified Mesorhizobium]AZV17808.1 PAS domain-containing sensor histidine kinase [Mesorhizobium sp. M7A.F.Ce.TU.012.03.2.1]RWQ19264.1 MAG: PAS domain-containing sensor histidine kinase [Mesorhizobium sp.]
MNAGNRYLDLFENAPCGYLVVAADGRIDDANTTFYKWTGFSREAVVGKRFRDILNIAGRMFYETHFAPLLRMQGSFDEVALDVMKSDGESLSVLANAWEKRTPTGELIETRVALFRATQRRRYERELSEARRELQIGLNSAQQTAELREQFIAVLGHDLRNPLASISAGVHMLARSSDTSDEKTSQVLRLMLASVSRMSGLIDNVLDFARGRLGGGLGLSRDRDNPIQPALQQVLDEIRSSYPERQIEVSFNLDGRMIDADHARIAQLFSNLMGNAIAHGDPETPIKVAAQVQDGLFSLSVANGGKPIPESALQRLFQPFYRGEAKSRQQGLGLGLFIASEIARAHGGSLDVVSDVEQTRFSLRIPAN